MLLRDELELGEWPPDVKSGEPKSSRKQPTQASQPNHATGFGAALCDARLRRKASQCEGPTYDNATVAGDAQSTAWRDLLVGGAPPTLLV